MEKNEQINPQQETQLEKKPEVPGKATFSSELLYDQLREKAQEVYGWASEYEYSMDKKESIDALKELIHQIEGDMIWDKIIEDLIMRDDLIFEVFRYRKKYDIMSHHPVNVTILSLKLGMGINLNSKSKLKRLGLAALVHDLGMAGILMSIMFKDTKLSTSEIKAIERHPSIGKSYLSKLGEGYEWLATVCYQEHEREKGQGYPEGLSKDQINLMAKIIGLMDTVDSMTHPRPWKKPIPPPDAMKALLTTQKDFFSPDLVKVLIKEVSLFPLGSYVRLNSNEIGQATVICKKHPLRPDILVLFDSNGMPVRDPKILQLSTHPILYIMNAVNSEELPSQLLQPFKPG